jgi:hypothetical protein
MSAAPGIASPRPRHERRSAIVRGSLPARTLRRVPAAAWVCAAIAVANAFTFSVIVPPFQAPDEAEHYAYTEYLAHTGRPPYRHKPATEFSPQEQAALNTLYFSSLAQPGTFHMPPWTAAGANEVKAALAAEPSRLGEGGITGESVNPPLYYAVAAIPYAIASGGSVLDRVAAMRILSTLLFGATVLFVFGFVRETLPRPPWAATAAALAVALQPQVAFVGGSINPDNLTFTAGAALFWLLARCARHGLNARRGAAIGLALAVGALAKLSFVALFPGAAIALLLFAARQRGVASHGAATGATVADGAAAGARRADGAATGATTADGAATGATAADGAATGRASGGAREAEAPSGRRWRGLFGDRPALNGLAAAAVVVAVPLVAYVIVNSRLWDRSLLGDVFGVTVIPTPSGRKIPLHTNSREFLSYVWQFYLPRLPGMRAQFTAYPLWTQWFKGSVGNFGLLDYGFPNWVYYSFLGVFIALVALAVRALIASRAALRRRWVEIVSYGVLVLGLLAANARVGYPYHRAEGYIFEQARYLFPLLALYGLFLALSMRGAGRRWGPSLAGVLVVGALAHTIFAQLLTLHRYWT